MSAIIRGMGLPAAHLSNSSRGPSAADVRGRRRNFARSITTASTNARRSRAISVDLILTSIPFSTQYEYTPSYNDFGHTDDNAFLAPDGLPDAESRAC